MSSPTFTKANANTNSLIGEARYQRVMLIDDNSLDNLVNKKLIETNGFADQVDAYESAVDALTQLKSNQPLPDIIFLDINMPIMDGFAFLDAFAQLEEKIKIHCKIIMLSTSDSFKDLNRANKNIFVKKFLNKPLTAEVVGAIKL